MNFKFQNAYVALTHFEGSFVFEPDENHVCQAIIIYFEYLDPLKEDFIYVFPDSPFLNFFLALSNTTPDLVPHSLDYV